MVDDNVRTCVRAYLRVCVRAYLRVCVRAYLRVRVRAYLRVRERALFLGTSVIFNQLQYPKVYPVITNKLTIFQSYHFHLRTFGAYRRAQVSAIVKLML